MQREIEPMAKISLGVKRWWTLWILSKTIHVPKKHLRKVFNILETKELETVIIEKDKPIKRIFYNGFMEFFVIRKGKRRQILAPHPNVQLVFKAIKEWLERINPPHPNAFGFVKNRNPKKAAMSLLDGKNFLGFDIADAFPSITVGMVVEAFRRIKVDETIVDVLAQLVTFYYDHERRLPQGSSCSPAILNLVYQPMLDEIQEVCQKHNLLWSIYPDELKWNVYADDFNFAGRLMNISPDLKVKLLSIPAKYGFQIKERKTRDNAGKTIPHVLGLTIVKGKIHINRQTKNKFRRILYAAKTGTYSPEQVRGVIGYVSHIYGEEKNWPGGLLKLYQQYQQK